MILTGRLVVPFMNTSRKVAIVSVNAAVAAWLFKVMFFPDGPDDTFGILFTFVLMFMTFFNIYAIRLARHFFKSGGSIYIELLFIVLLLLPFFLLWSLRKI